MIAALALCAEAVLGTRASAIPLNQVRATSQVVQAASNCYAVGQAVAAQKGGTLAKASDATRGGRTVCVIVVLVPGKDGQRPRRVEVVVPQG